MSRRAWLIFVAMGCIWGTPYLFISITDRELAPETMIFFRCIIAACALVPFARRRFRWNDIARHWFALACYSVVEIAAPWYLVAAGETRITSSLAGLIIATVPIFGLALGFAFGSERRVHWLRFFGLAIGFAGVMATIGIDLSSSDGIGIAELVAAAFGYALGPAIFGRYLANIPPETTVATSFIVAGVLYTPAGLTHLPQHLSLEVALALVALALFCSVTGFLLFFRLVLAVGPARATVVTYVNPVVAVVAGVIFLREPFSSGLAIGTPLVVIGSILATWDATHRPRVRLATTG